MEEREREKVRKRERERVGGEEKSVGAGEGTEGETWLGTRKSRRVSNFGVESKLFEVIVE